MAFFLIQMTVQNIIDALVNVVLIMIVEMEHILMLELLVAIIPNQLDVDFPLFKKNRKSKLLLTHQFLHQRV